MEDTLEIILTIALIVFLVIVGPLLMIWSVNTLFSTGIEYSLSTWTAALLLGGLLTTKKG